MSSHDNCVFCNAWEEDKCFQTSRGMFLSLKLRNRILIKKLDIYIYICYFDDFLYTSEYTEREKKKFIVNFWYQ